MYSYEVLHPDLVSLIGAAPEGASHWGLQRKKRGSGEREGWSTLAFPADAAGVCRHEVPVQDLSLETIRAAEGGAGGTFRVKWLADEGGSLRQAGMGRVFTLAAEAGEDAAPPAVSASPRRAGGQPQSDPLALMMALLANDREAAKEQRDRQDREDRDRREERREREEREERERRRREDQDREDRKAALAFEREKLQREYEDRAAQRESFARLTDAITRQGDQIAAMAARVQALEEEDDEEDEPEGDTPDGEEDPIKALVREGTPLAKRALEAVVEHFAPPTGAAE